MPQNKLDRKYCLYGIGAAGQNLAKNLMDHGYSVKKFIDHRSVPEQKIFNVPCVQPEEINDEDDHVIIAIFNRDVDILKIKEKIESPKRTILTLPQAYLELQIPFESYWFSSLTEKKTISENINQIKCLFKEDHSIHLLEKIQAFRQTGNFKDLPVAEGLIHQYFPKNIQSWNSKEIRGIVDCGAFDGDTFSLSQKNCPQLIKYIGFEPDPSNFLELTQKMLSIKDINYKIFPYATWNINQDLFFDNGQSESSHIAKTGLKIKAIRLDDFLHDEYDFLKIDVEGADLQTLEGATDWIKKFTPKMAISLYHKPNHLWEIPLYLNGLKLHYDYYLRQHGQLGMDTILYAIPRK